LAKTFPRGSGKTECGADALLWGVETPHEWLVLARMAPHSSNLMVGEPVAHVQGYPPKGYGAVS